MTCFCTRRDLKLVWFAFEFEILIFEFFFFLIIFSNPYICVLSDWLAQSPDLNAIESLWRDLKARVSSCRPGNIETLWRTCEEQWTIIPAHNSKLIKVCQGGFRRLSKWRVWILNTNLEYLGYSWSELFIRMCFITFKCK